MDGEPADRTSTSPEAFRELLAAGTRKEGVRTLVDLVSRHAAAALGVGRSEVSDPRRRFADLGLSSLSAVELHRRLRAELDISLPLNEIYDHPTALGLAESLAGRLFGQEPDAPVSPAGRSGADDPVVIVGTACRLPGGITSPDELWQALLDGRDVIGPFPEDRGWAVESLYDPDPDRAGRTYARSGGFLDGAAEFDAGFFGISPREAQAMDPQQRQLLETAWELFERAGIDPLSVRGSSTGVFIGAENHEYGPGMQDARDGAEGHLITGTAGSVASGRIAYELGLHGPALTIDTACSASLVALHVAARSLREGECDQAIVGGVAVMATPGSFLAFSRVHGLSPDGRCKAFGAGADGTGWSEGVGMLLVERLSTARERGHRVLAVLRGSAVNSDGTSAGLTAPNGVAQQRVIRQALADAGLKPAEVDAVEAHGTGTPLGDPIEAAALQATYGPGRDADRPLLLGSVKSNLGHTQAAAGVIGVIKMISAMGAGVLPRTLHAEPATPHLEWAGSGVELLTRQQQWPDRGEPRRCAVSSFGFSGTNVHVVLEQATVEASVEQAPVEQATEIDLQLPLVVSARSPEALRAQAARLRDVVASDARPLDVAFSAATTRAALKHRATVLGADRGELLGGLDALAKGEHRPNVGTGIVQHGRLAFVFPGQGAQKPAMGRELHARFPAFARAFDAACAEVDLYLDRPLASVVFAEPGSADADLLVQTAYTQPALFVFQVALFRLLESWGLHPDVVIGHSIGEVAAAHVAGIWSLSDAAAFAAHRGRLLQALPEGGGMVAARATEEQILELLSTRSSDVCVAAVNGPEAVVLSGPQAEVLALAADLTGRGIKCTPLKVSHAFHSALMEPALDELRWVAEVLTYRSPKLPIVSTVTGALITEDEFGTPGYWVRQVHEPVRFADAVSALRGEGVTSVLELGSGAALSAMVAEVLVVQDSFAAPALRSGQHEASSLVATLAALHTRGAGPDWSLFFAGHGARRVDLPTYAFQRQRFWLESGTDHAVSTLDHPILDSAFELAGTGDTVFTGRVSRHTHPWLGDHRILGRVLVPGTALLELAIRAGDEVGCDRVAELVLETPLVLGERDLVRLQVAVGAADADGFRSLTIHAKEDNAAVDRGWTRHATGVLAPGTRTFEFDDVWPPAGAVAVDLDGFYDRLATAGFDYGPAFHGLSAVWRRGDDVFAEVGLPEPGGSHPGVFGLHPALLDAALHAPALVGPASSEQTTVPFSWGDVVLHATDAVALRVRISTGGGDSVRVLATDPTGTPVFSAESLVLRSPVFEADSGHDHLWCLDWVPLAADADAQDCFTVLGRDPGRLADGLRGAANSVESHPGFSAEVADGAKLFVLPVDASTGVRAMLADTLATARAWLADDRFEDTRLVVVTRGAVSVAGEPVTDPAAAAVWGLIRSAQAENPGRFVLVDLDGENSVDDSASVLAGLLASEEPQAVIRAGAVRIARLTRLADTPDAGLLPPVGETPWRLDSPRRGSLDELTLSPFPAAAAPLSGREVRLRVTAAGVNFRDVLNALGMYPGEAGPLGAEAAGVVVETGPEVRVLRQGDRVMGMIDGAFGPAAVVDERLLARVPAHWSDADAASVPLVFLTAYYALTDLAGLRPGQSVLVHAGAGGVGMAAIALARHLGADVFATASEGKWDTLRSLGIADDHLASSRTTGFEARFLEVTGGRGVDLVLNSLAGEFVDASLRVLAPGGRFLELGKTDIRDAAELHGISYRAFDLAEAGPDRIQEMLTALLALFADGSLAPLPVRSWDVRHAPDAFRFMSQAKHIGKIVLRMPRVWDPEGTVLITGGTGGLGGILARHLVSERHVRHLVLASRSGPAAAGAPELVRELGELGAHVTVHACDVSDRAEVAALLAGVPAGHPLTAVVHAAGVVDDGVLSSITDESLETVLAPKLDAAWHLHELTADLDLAAFVLFSSVAGLLGSAGQGNYAAANAGLDALAHYRRDRGLPATALAWSAWAPGSGMTAALTGADLARMAREGLPALTAERALGLFDLAIGSADPVLVPATVDIRPPHDQSLVPHVFRGLVRTTARRSVAACTSREAGLVERLRDLSAEDRERTLVTLIQTEAAAVLGHGSASEVEAGRAFQELGFDSLTSVELRNRLTALTGLRLAPTAVFSHPTPLALAAHLLGELGEPAGAATAKPVPAAVADGDPIVIVGMSCRYPGGVRSPEDLWDLVVSGRDAIGAFPEDRGWDLDGLYDPDGVRPGTSTTRSGGFLQEAAEFDAEFFRMSPREAQAADPQQRILLEVSWEAFEAAGIAPDSLTGSPTGVFIGASSSDYATLLSSTDRAEGFVLTGNTGSVMSGRISYTFGLEGPSMTVDTACSSSLVALHSAAQSLRAGECSLALAGGVAVLSEPSLFVEFSKQGGLAADGRCKSFSENADGTSWAEGAGMLVLERLSDARRHGHRILATVRGSAVNSDGTSNGLTAPNGSSQQRVIRAALDSAGLAPSEVDVVEAHGTGTALGDPIEAQALLATYGQNRRRPLWLGSIKANLGHTQAAAGVAGVIKMILAMRHETMPESLHVGTPSSQVDWTTGEVALLTARTPWPEADHLRRAGVSSFGLSGTNAHVIIESPAAEPVRAAMPSAIVPWLVSARNEAALEDQLGRIRRFAGTNPAESTVDIGFSLVSGRSQFEHRAALIPGGGTILEVSRGVAAPAPFAMLFPGQGSQRVGMGQELHARFPAFAAAFDAAAEHLDAGLGRPLRDVLWGEDHDLLNETGWAQPALFAVEVALFRLLESWGVEPGFVAGHSIGEIAAAQVAGVLSLRDAAALVLARGRLMQALPTGGAMVSVRASEEEVLPLLTADVSIAAINGPDAVVVSGADQAVSALAAAFAAQGRKTKRLPVSHAFHSPLMSPMLDDFRAVVETLEFHPPRIPVVSTVTGALADQDDLCSPDYWVRHVTETVRFADGVAALRNAGAGAFLELGPDGVLSAMARQTLPADAVVIPALRKDRGEESTIVAALSGLHVSGVRVDWAGFFVRTGARRIDLPTYAFQHQRFWPDNPPGGDRASDAASVGLTPVRHPLLDGFVALAGDAGVVFTSRLSTRSHPWLADHVVLGRVLLPGTAFAELAIRAGDETGCARVEELTLAAPLVLPDRGAVQVRVSVGAPGETGRRGIEIHSRLDGERDASWVRHASGSLVPETSWQPAAVDTVWPPAGAEPVAVDGCYEGFLDAGFDYGPAFQGLRAAWRRGDELFAEVTLPEHVREGAGEFGLHPALLDAALHALFFADPDGTEHTGAVPFSWEGVSLHATGASSVRVRLIPSGEKTVSITISDPMGAPVASVDSLVSRALSSEQVRESGSDSLFGLDWSPVATGDPGEPGALAILGTDTFGLQESGVSVTCYADLADLPEEVPEVVLIGVGSADTHLVEAAHELTASTLKLLQDWLDAERFTRARLVFVTRGATTGVDPAAASVWGLVRTAQSENPGRFALLDVDAPDAAALVGAVLSEETELTVRGGEVSAARLVRRTVAPRPLGWAAEGTVLITGGTGGLGRLLARHLVTTHGVRRLILASRSGAASPGAGELVTELAGLGAEVSLAACDIADLVAVRGLVATVPAAHPLTAVVHTAGVLDDGVLATLTPDRLDAVLRPKVDAAWNLHEATAELGLAAFVLFSSIAGVLGSPGQGNYAAANTFLDSLAQLRRNQGLPAVSLAWGPWAQETGMTSMLSGADIARMSRDGVTPLSRSHGLSLFDAAVASEDPLVVATSLDIGALRARREVPPLLRALVPGVRREMARAATPAGADTVARRAAGLHGDERTKFLLDLVRTEVAAVLGHATLTAIGATRDFRDLGFDSLTSVELRNQLNSATGLRLPATLVFDYPTPGAVAGFLSARLPAEGNRPPGSPLEELNRLEAALKSGTTEHEAVARRLDELVARLRRPARFTDAKPKAAKEDIESASVDQLLGIIDEEFSRG
ncbi:SDR family NAD(P)-dependent oxidoreductase [Amycolatopsis sp. H20-H5]|uniref:SDR family NAD(P)-dependent oxidoreductase n=1 Tax=Amycolatopsis sp. H20-H5 TaxID=3046309 RepID=UPI002DBB0730|nr:SDR family NAD(P)-dependent oxidoreductase [Amycolatopsis sp. H20-H5]MEC3981058.1 SDR family NAD(P)-dependent oxidoreductase [Amycolatopsis sp. H20-H5]